MISRFLLLVFLNVVLSQYCPYVTDKIIGSRCYMFVKKVHNYEGARQYCHDYGYSLATVDTSVVASFMASIASSEFGILYPNFWIGLSRNSSLNLFQWDDSTPLGFTNFSPGFPNGQDYVIENTFNGKWETVFSTFAYPFVCSVKTGTVFTTTTRQPTTTTIPTSTIPITTTQRTTCSVNFTLIGTKCYTAIIYGNDSDYPTVLSSDAPLTAEQYRCDKVGAKLASIHSKYVQVQINKLINQTFNESIYATIGLQNLDTTIGKWAWSDNTTLNYTFYEDSFPNNDDLITQISFKGTWVTYKRTSPSEAVICSMDL